MTRRVIAAAALAVAVAFSGCDGIVGTGANDTSKKDDGPLKTGEISAKAEKAPAIGAGRATPAKASLLSAEATGATASAGTSKGYEPTGEIIADSGFRPETDGFNFENYGNDVEPENMTAREMVSLFGAQVCAGGEADDCTLIPAAKRWMENENARMNGGHCMGFSVAALRFWEETLSTGDFGADATHKLVIPGNTDLQSLIAESWVYQDLPQVQRKMVQGVPSDVLQKLADSLNDGSEQYTIGIFKADGSGGHAITPFAIEETGDGTYAILVYDNNFPGITRAIDVDLNEETWHYVGGTNPKDLDEVYEGNAETQSLMLLPTGPGEKQQPCPFCSGEDTGDGGDLGSVLPKDEQYSEITLGGAVTNHPHLILTDDKDRQTGIIDGKLVNDIPGVRVVQSFSTRNWEAAPEPKFQVPPGADIAMTVDGSSLTKTATSKIDIVGNGLVIAIDEVKIRPGQQDNVFISGEGYGLYYESNGKDESPEFFAGLTDGDNSYTFAATAVGIRKGSTVGLIIDKESGTVLLDGDGSKGSIEGKAYFALVVDKVTADYEHTWTTSDLKLGDKDGVYFNYKETPKAGKPLKLEVGPEDGPFKTVRAQWDP